MYVRDRTGPQLLPLGSGRVEKRVSCLGACGVSRLRLAVQPRAARRGACRSRLRRMIS